MIFAVATGLTSHEQRHRRNHDLARRLHHRAERPRRSGPRRRRRAAARKAAGDKNVMVMGGADLLRQYLDAGAIDELTLTISPVLLGGGKRLFDGIGNTDIAFERTGVI